jgi:hypothetical protein
LISLALALIWAAGVPLWCCCKPAAPTAGASAVVPRCHGEACARARSEQQRSPLNGSRCPSSSCNACHTDQLLAHSTDDSTLSTAATAPSLAALIPLPLVIQAASDAPHSTPVFFGLVRTPPPTSLLHLNCALVV